MKSCSIPHALVILHMIAVSAMVHAQSLPVKQHEGFRVKPATPQEESLSALRNPTLQAQSSTTGVAQAAQVAQTTQAPEAPKASGATETQPSPKTDEKSLKASAQAQPTATKPTTSKATTAKLPQAAVRKPAVFARLVTKAAPIKTTPPRAAAAKPMKSKAVTTKPPQAAVSKPVVSPISKHAAPVPRTLVHPARPVTAPAKAKKAGPWWAPISQRLAIAQAQVSEPTRALLGAAGHNDAVLIQALIKQGIDINKSDWDGKTALHTAARLGFLDIVKQLSKAGARVNVADAVGNTPLHEAAATDTNSLEIIQELVRQGADVNALNLEHKTPLWIAASNQDITLDAIKELIRDGANTTIASLHEKRTPVQEAQAMAKLFSFSKDARSRLRQVIDYLTSLQDKTS